MVTVQITHPHNGDGVNQATLQILATASTDAAGATIVGGTVSINGGTPFALVWDATLQRWKKVVAIPTGVVTAVVVITDSTSTSGTDAVTFTNGSLVNPPTVSFNYPTEGTVVNTSSIVASGDAVSSVGIDPTSVQFSYDGGLTWLTGTRSAGDPGGA